MNLDHYEGIVRSYLTEHSISFSKDSIPYGISFKVLDGTVHLNLYHGKKGFRFHIQGKDKEAVQLLEEEMNLLFSRQDSKKSTQENDLRVQYDVPWMGSDESGKGDVFGPIICAGVVLQPSESEQLLAAGFKDSKALSKGRIEGLANQVFRLGPKRYHILKLKPAKYNDLYARFQSQGKNLNHLLGWMHASVIKELASKNPSLKIAVVDQFSKTDRVGPLLDASCQSLTLIQRTRAEANLAVAAGSILARYELLKWHQSMKQELGFELPLGASPQTVSCGKRFVTVYGADALPTIAKMHFKTIEQILA